MMKIARRLVAMFQNYDVYAYAYAGTAEYHQRWNGFRAGQYTSWTEWTTFMQAGTLTFEMLPEFCKDDLLLQAGGRLPLVNEGSKLRLKVGHGRYFEW